MKQDLTLLRPFDLRAVAQGDAVCDTRGRELTIDGAAELVHQSGIEALRMSPEMWLEGKPVYWGSVVQTAFGHYPYNPDTMGPQEALGWPSPAPERVLELYIDGKRVDTFTLPPTAHLVYWKVVYDNLGEQYATESKGAPSERA